MSRTLIIFTEQHSQIDRYFSMESYLKTIKKLEHFNQNKERKKTGFASVS